MRIVFISNFLTHHQLPLLDALNSFKDVSCLFIETEKMPEHRVKLGYRREQREFVVPLEKLEADIDREIMGCDVLISGGIRPEYIRIANRYHKSVFVFSERLFKDSGLGVKNLLRAIKYRKYAPLLRNAYLLCASGFAYADYASLGLFRERAYQWGYFPDVRYYDPQKLLSEKNCRQILWCGRFLTWKHYDDVLEAAHQLKRAGYDFTLSMIGIGEGLEYAERFVNDKHLGDCVQFLGAMSTDEVRDHMEKAGIFAFTSDRREGWGAVLNEAMGSGCAVISSDAAGAAPVLITHKKNGLIYPARNTEALFRRLKRLLDEPLLQKQLGQAACRTVAEQWNPRNAACRFVKLCESIKLCDDPTPPSIYDNGVCSKAIRIKDGWFNTDIP